jgi:sialate O-acetylesterase
VAATRRDLKTPNLPWLVVQIARVFGIGIDVRSWNQIQEEQRRLPDRIKNLETVAAIDLPLDDGIHISALGYPRLGARLARAADRLVYGYKKEPAAPRLRRIELSEPGRGSAERRIEVEFDGIVGGLRAAGEPHGFSLVQSDGTPWPFCYKITLKGDRVRLHVGRLMDGMMLHYGHGSAPVCNITDARDMSLPVFGPLPVSRPRAYLPFVNQWLVTDPVVSEIPLHRVACPDPAALGAVARTYGVDGFINEHPRWMGKSGHGYFSCRIELPEAMKLQVLLGYDGPFRLWIDGKSVFTDMNGINPCLPDAVARPVALAAGVHRITVGMDLNQGRAWGFMLRFVRQDVSAAQIAAKSFAVPAYLPVE